MIEAPFEVGRMLGRLNDADLPYVVVGGIAVIVHGYVRPTEDLDVLVPERREIGEALQALLAAWDATRLDGSALPDALFSGRRGAKPAHAALPAAYASPCPTSCVSTSYCATAGSAVMIGTPRAVACATSRRSNGSR